MARGPGERAGRPWPRTWLFAPASDEHKLSSALRSGAEVVIADLEDAVARDRKEDARRRAAQFGATAERGPWRIVRINDPRTDAGLADLGALADAPLDAVMVPKATVESLDLVIGAVPQVVALVETARGIKDAEEIATRPTVVALALGSVDLAGELGLRSLPDASELLYARSRLVLDCMAAGAVPAIDGVYTAIDDPQGLSTDATRARALGFSAKLCVHPNQLDAVVRAFSPSQGELAHSRRVIEAYANAAPGGKGALSVDGGLVDLATVRLARRVLAEERSEE